MLDATAPFSAPVSVTPSSHGMLMSDAPFLWKYPRHSWLVHDISESCDINTPLEKIRAGRVSPVARPPRSEPFVTSSAQRAGDLPARAGDGADHRADTGEEEADAGAVGVLPEDRISQDDPEGGGKEGEADDSCDGGHDDLAFLVKISASRRPRPASRRPCLRRRSRGRRAGGFFRPTPPGGGTGRAGCRLR